MSIIRKPGESLEDAAKRQGQNTLHGGAARRNAAKWSGRLARMDEKPKQGGGRPRNR